jgi:hypothetical protein
MKERLIADDDPDLLNRARDWVLPPQLETGNWFRSPGSFISLSQSSLPADRTKSMIRESLQVLH